MLFTNKDKRFYVSLSLVSPSSLPSFSLRSIKTSTIHNATNATQQMWIKWRGDRGRNLDVQLYRRPLFARTRCIFVSSRYNDNQKEKTKRVIPITCFSLDLLINLDLVRCVFISNFNIFQASPLPVSRAINITEEAWKNI
ncbi:uncharacterized protein LOC114876473 isoform X2 [Osmia bicornis bicornis]|uniref:uncharacterized protein LOC114876473 isoform X2 n=1 Tax=Osmia bicornis bicornis TaxID=1437191 RepID=UPI001EAF097A|nr:uncharacterized protein LOC114876473 isoform X2 [Osmia bicornis bicornis]